MAEQIIDKIIEIIKSCNKELSRVEKVKDKCMNADLIKTIKAMHYEKIKSIMKKEG